MPAGLRTKGLLRKGTILGSAVALVAAITAASAGIAQPVIDAYQIGTTPTAVS